MKYGDRIGAILEGQSAKLIGYGFYGGEKSCPVHEGDLMPRLILDRGGYVWGSQCLWGSEERIKKETDRLKASAMDDVEYLKLMADPKMAKLMEAIFKRGDTAEKIASAICSVMGMQFGMAVSGLRDFGVPLEMARQASLLASAMELSVTMTGIIGKLDTMNDASKTVLDKFNDLWKALATDVQDVVNRHMSAHGLKTIDLVAFGNKPAPGPEDLSAKEGDKS